MKYLIIIIAFILTAGCSSITGDLDNGTESLEIDKFGEVASSTAKSNYKDADSNGIPDEGEIVAGAYKSLYAFDGFGDFYWDLGDGRIQGTVDSVDELDQETITVCDYKVQYRGSFENTPSLATGWIKNNILCSGVDNGNYNYLIVHETDKRYTGNPDWAIWGTWEYHTYAVRGEGNLIRPESHVIN